MSSRGKKKTTMAKLSRESRLRERRQEKAARKDARKHAAEFGPPPGENDELADDPMTDGDLAGPVADGDLASPVTAGEPDPA